MFLRSILLVPLMSFSPFLVSPALAGRNRGLNRKSSSSSKQPKNQQSTTKKPATDAGDARRMKMKKTMKKTLKNKKNLSTLKRVERRAKRKKTSDPAPAATDPESTFLAFKANLEKYVASRLLSSENVTSETVGKHCFLRLEIRK